MTRLQRLWARNTRCRATTHKVDWVWHAMTGVRRCLTCESAMPEPVLHVGQIHPDQGD